MKNISKYASMVSRFGQIFYEKRIEKFGISSNKNYRGAYKSLIRYIN